MLTTQEFCVASRTNNEIAAVRPLTSHLTNYRSKTDKICGALLEKQRRADALLWAPAHGRVRAGQSARTYLNHLCTDTGYSQEDLPKTMDDKRVLENYSL